MREPQGRPAGRAWQRLQPQRVVAVLAVAVSGAVTCSLAARQLRLQLSGDCPASEQPEAGAVEEEPPRPAEALEEEVAAPPAVPEVRAAPPTRYRLRTGAGAALTGELHAQVQGVKGEPAPQSWLLEYRRRWESLLFSRWQPSTSVRVHGSGHESTMRWSRSLLPDASPEERRTLDGTGLDLNVETTVSGHWPQRPAAPAELELTGLPAPVGSTPAPLALQQRVEVVVGPRAQARYLNLTLPVGLSLGAAFDSTELRGNSRGSPLGFYARFTVPGLRQLRGWFGEVELLDSFYGLMRGQLQRPWTKGGESQWGLEHTRTHGVFALPKALAQGSAAVVGAAASLLGGGVTETGQPELMAAVVPTTRLRAGSAGKAAALSMESAEAGLGGAGWGGMVEASQSGWGARLQLAGPKTEGWGQQRYAITAHTAWAKRPSLVHEVKWLTEDGQGLWLTLQQDPGRPTPRLNVGMEIR